MVLPGRARSIGNWRSLAVNNGRSEDTLTCAIGVGSGRDDGTGRAFQARDRWGHIGATSGPRTTGSQRTTTVTSGPASCQFTSHIRPDSAGRRQRPAVPDTEEDGGSNPVAPTIPPLTSTNAAEPCASLRLRGDEHLTSWEVVCGVGISMTMMGSLASTFSGPAALSGGARRAESGRRALPCLTKVFSCAG